MKQSLIENVSVFLLKKGFVVKNLKGNCFDILGRDDSNILLLKVLEDANSITRQFSDEMDSVSVYTNATPILICEKAGNKLEDNVIYHRFGICTINFQTLVNCVNKKYPFIKRSKAGLIASIIGEKMKERRVEMGISLNAMSKKLGVTSRMISKYEQGSSEVTIQRAMKIYDIFGENVFFEFNIFENNESVLSNVRSDFSRKYVDIGFEATDTKKSPFDIISRKEDHLIMTDVGDKVNPDSVALSRLLDAENLVIYDNKKPKDIAALNRDEFLEVMEAEELLKYLREF